MAIITVADVADKNSIKFFGIIGLVLRFKVLRAICSTDKKGLYLMKLPISILYVISLLTFLSITASAESLQRTIVTSGQGEVSVAPDMAELNMELRAVNKDRNKAKRELDQQFNQLLDELALLNIQKKAIIASSLQLTPQYDYATEKRKFVGYRAVRKITITINKLEQLNQVLDTALTAGIDQLGRVNLKVADETSYQKQSRQQAINQSKAIAKELALAYGARLGPIIQINYRGSDIQYPQPLMKRQRSEMMMADSDTGVYLHDTIKFNDRISVIFELLVTE